MQSHFIVKLNLVLRLVWGFDNKGPLLSVHYTYPFGWLAGWQEFDFIAISAQLDLNLD